VNGKRVAHGHYNTVWVRQADQQLKFAVDIGAQHAAPEPDVIPTDVKYATTAGYPSKNRDVDILALESRLSDAIRSKGMAKAYAAVLSNEAQLTRPDQYPLTAPELQRQHLAAQTPLTFQPARGQVSQAGDMAYAYGTYQAEQQPTTTGSYLHIWKHETAKRWRLVLEVLNPSPVK
jgi:ketosteroid isomerase-like protein